MGKSTFHSLDRKTDESIGVGLQAGVRFGRRVNDLLHPP